MNYDPFESQRANRMAERMTSSAEVVAEITHEITQQVPVTANRIIAGETNEVYDIELPNDNSLILRIHHGTESRFESESWAISQSRDAGVPVPAVLGVGTHVGNGSLLHYMGQEKLLGRPLNDLIREGALPDKRKQKILEDAGEALARIHSVPTKGFGDLDAIGRGKYASLAEWFANVTPQQYQTSLHAYGLNNETLCKAFDLLERVGSEFREERPHLVHDDFAPKHVLVADDQITGIIDFEFAKSGHFGFDIPEWELRDSKSAPMNWLLEGYERIKPLKKQALNLQKACILYKFLVLFDYYAVESPHPQIASICAEAIAANAE